MGDPACKNVGIIGVFNFTEIIEKNEWAKLHDRTGRFQDTKSFLRNFNN